MNASSLLFVLLSLCVVLLSAAPAEARRSLLPEGSHPPVFSLPDKSGKAVSLRAFLGLRRIVVLFTRTQESMDTLHTEHARFADRDLTTLAIVPPGSRLTTTDADTHILTDVGDKVARKYGALDGRPAFYLIGKDGHIALARYGFPIPHDLYGIIDAMPMRRQEMRERGR